LHRAAFLALASTLALAAAAHAQSASGSGASPGPQPLPPQAPIAAPQDVAYPGVIQLSVDATDLDRRIFKVRETIPIAQAGPVTLLYPKWLPGNHSPSGPLSDFAGLVVRANGQVVPWRRDPAEVFAFHLDAPAGATQLEVEFQFVSPTTKDQGRIVVTPEMLNLQWNQMVLYPAGYFARRIAIQPSMRLPAGWKFASALDRASRTGDEVKFAATNLETLVDSPVFAGRWFKEIDLDAKGRAPVRLNIIADNAEDLDASDEQIALHRELVRQADALFGSRHYDHYDFLLALTDRMGSIGLEHHRSSENSSATHYFTEWSKDAPYRDLLPHEYTHSWNGKFRRPADLWTPDYSTPMRDSLLWVYEGQTQYWGQVLATRSGLWTKEQALDALAMTAALYGGRPGRSWRPVEDTTNDPIISARRPIPWTSWQRSEDYYSEGQLVWLDVDTLIRERSGGKRSLDDFARAFFGVNDGSWTPLTYGFDEVVAALNKVQPYDWAAFLRARLIDVAPNPPFGGLERGGWRLVFSDKPTAFWKDNEARRRGSDFSYSIGLSIGRDGVIDGVQWDGPAFKAGLAVGGKVLAINGEAYDADDLKAAITEAKTGREPIQLLVQTGEHFKTVPIDYHGGLRYPKLERIEGTPDRLSAILAPRG
jgi:predicted metalloprotease with PDZ domain